jgi:hypothetical protein
MSAADVRGLGRSWALIATIALFAGCGHGPHDPGAALAPVVPPARATLPDPAPEVVDEIETLVTAWVAARAGEGGVFQIPPRGGRSVAGTLGGFHAVRQTDADTYTVCVDFLDGENVYDVDVFVDRAAAGLAVREAYLHRVNGEVVSG